MAEQDSPLDLPRFDTPPRMLIVASPYYRDIADALMRGARKVFDGFGVEPDVVEVPGALEVPTTIRLAAHRYDGFVALGCVLRGETSHYDIVSEQSAAGLLGLGIGMGLCIGNGILTCETREQAMVRADPARMDKGGGAAAAALHLIALRQRFGPAPKGHEAEILLATNRVTV